jgi:hypothetical protein
MTNPNQLQTWCIVRLLPNMQRVVVARLHRRKEAEDYLKFIKQMTPAATYTLIFDAPSDGSELAISESFRVKEAEVYGRSH